MGERLEGGSRFLDTGPVTIGCMRPDARDLLDRAVAAYKEQRKADPVDVEQSVYQTLYWLFRWSGVIEYDRPAAGD